MKRTFKPVANNETSASRKVQGGPARYDFDVVCLEGDVQLDAAIYEVPTEEKEDIFLIKRNIMKGAGSTGLPSVSKSKSSKPLALTKPRPSTSPSSATPTDHRRHVHLNLNLS